MILTVNGNDVTTNVVSDSVRWVRYGTFQSELFFTVETNGSDTDIRIGMETTLYREDGTDWCGTVTETRDVRRSDRISSLNVKCRGFETAVSRKVSDAFSYESMTAGQIAKILFTEYLVNEEEFSDDDTGIETDGEILEKYSSPGAKLSKIFDDLAQACGKKWWIGEDKAFNFRQSIPVTDHPYCIDTEMTEENALDDVSELSFSGKTADYRNVQIVFGKNNVRGEARNDAEIARMAQYGGSGEYANITVNRNILTEEAANEAAANILRAYENDAVTAAFTTANGDGRLFDRIYITAPKFGFSEATPFVITEIEGRSLKNGKFVYRITAKYSNGTDTGYRPADGWTEQFGQLVNKTDENVQGSQTSSAAGLTPDDILAGENITLEKTDSTVKINAKSEALLRLTAAAFTESGVTYTLENGTSHNYVFGYDGDGNLSSLTDDEGNVITVSGL